MSRLFPFIVAAVLLNTGLTVVNHWPSPWARPAALLAPELLLIILLGALVAAIRGQISSLWRWGAAVVLLALMVGRYAIVTTEGLFGRPVNLYWEAVRIPDVAGLLVDATPVWLLALGAAGGCLALAALVRATRWCVSALASGVEGVRGRNWVMSVCVLLLAGYMTQRGGAGEVLYARASAPAYARQIGLVVDHVMKPRLALPALPQADIAADGVNRDVYVVFFESYGAIVFDDPLRVAALRTAYDDLEAVLEGSTWSAVSAVVDSTTFGGASWLAHSSLLSGQRVKDQRDYLSLMESAPALLTHRFRAAGYRTIGLVPGITQAWSEGGAFGYDQIYDAAALGYEGPRFGWWEIPDQFSLAQLQRREIDQPNRAPLFVVYPTVMSHMPFGPTPPYIENWDDLAEVYGETTPEDLTTDRRQAYLGAVRYNLAVLGGFLRQRERDKSVVIVLGDHQPPALITGPGASWAVPVHVFSQDRDALAAFGDMGFDAGVRPGRAVVGNIADLTAAVAASGG